MYFVSCAPSLKYMTNYPLTGGVFYSRDRSFSGKIPQGWFSSAEDTLAASLVAWLIKEDFTATITIRELKLDKLSMQRVSKDGIGLLAHVSAGLQDGNPSISLIDPEEFEIQGKKFCSYEANNSIGRKRVVIFKAKDKFYECEVHPLKNRWTADDVKGIFTVQQSVLSSLAF